MVLGELLDPINLFETQAFYIHEATKIVVVYKDEYFILAAFQIVMLCLEGFDNS